MRLLSLNCEDRHEDEKTTSHAGAHRRPHIPLDGFIKTFLNCSLNARNVKDKLFCEELRYPIFAEQKPDFTFWP
jgi:hypothetical protein